MESVVERLTPVILRLFQLAGDTRLTEEARASAKAAARTLSDFQTELTRRQFRAETPEYAAALREVERVDREFSEALQDVGGLARAIQGTTKLLGAIERLVKRVGAG
jgi:hypothetical protein